MSGTIEETLARFAHAPIRSDAARQMMRLSLYDWAACGMAGKTEAVAAILRARAHQDGGAAQATLIGGGRVPARAAALVNGTASHALDYDDTHFGHIGHASVAIVPAALAAAERSGASMQALVDAALVGAEASVRVGMWLGRDHYETGFHQTATAGAFGATLAAARLLGLSEDQTVAALGVAATRASGLKSQFGTMGKPYNAGLAAETGIEAAELAQAGFTSAKAGLSGPQGFGPTHHGQNEVEAFDTLGRQWRFETVSHKFHACCHGLHAMIEAVLALNVDPTKVAAVAIRTHPRWLTVCNKPEPATGLEAKFSYRLVCAMALSGVDTSSVGTYSDAVTKRADLVAMRNRVTVTGDARVDEMKCLVSIALTDGTERAGGFDLDAPMSPQDRAARLQRKASGLLGSKTAAALWSAVDGANIEEFLRLLAQK